MQAKIEKFIVIHSRQIAQEIIDAGQALIKMEPSRHRRGKLGTFYIPLFKDDTSQTLI